MANEALWKRPWEHQSSNSHVGTSTHPLATAEATPLLPDPTAAVTSTISRRLPPLHASLDASAEPIQPATSRRNSTHSDIFDIASPNLAWQHEWSGIKRRKLRDIGRDDSHTTHAYSSSPSHDGRHHHAQSSHAQRALPPVSIYDKRTDDGTHSTDRFSTAVHEQQTADRRLTKASPASALLTPCCSPNCTGSRCSRIRALLADVLSEFGDLDLRLQGAIAGAPVQSSLQPPNVEQAQLDTRLEWLLERLRWNNAGIKSLRAPTAQVSHQQDEQVSRINPPPSATSEGNTDLEASLTRIASPDTMKRRRGEADKEPQVPRRLAPAIPVPPSAGASIQPSGLMSGPNRQLPPATPLIEQPPGGVPSQSSMSSSSSALQPPQYSPLNAPQHFSAVSGRTLPSPSSLNFPSAQQPSGHAHSYTSSGPSSNEHASGSTPAHLQLLQDLQHQVSVKTLALQTLQCEYDALLAKLERQRTKCMTLEKKFEVTDVEINSLTDERERLQSQVTLLESQVEELTKGRDEARKEMAESGRQYIRIVEMASRLQAQGAEDRKKWDDERKELVERIRLLELGIAESDDIEPGTPRPTGDSSRWAALGLEPGMSILDTMQTITPTTSAGTTSASKPLIGASLESDGPSGPSRSSTSNPQDVTGPVSGLPDQMVSLRAEVRRLRSRTNILEAAIRSTMEENRSMQEALQAVTASGQRMEDAMAKALGSD